MIIHKYEVMPARPERTDRSLSPAGRRYIKSFIHQQIPDYAQCALIAINDQYPALPLSPHNLSLLSGPPIECRGDLGRIVFSFYGRNGTKAVMAATRSCDGGHFAGGVGSESTSEQTEIHVRATGSLIK